MPPDEKEKTTISVYKETVDRLKDYGKKGDTYDDIIIRLLDEMENKGEIKQ